MADNNIRSGGSEIENYDYEVAAVEGDPDWELIYIEPQYCMTLLPVKIHVEDWKTTTLEELGQMITDRMVRAGLYRGVASSKERPRPRVQRYTLASAGEVERSRGCTR